MVDKYINETKFLHVTFTLRQGNSSQIQINGEKILSNRATRQ